MPDNVESMFYIGDRPWHKRGIHLDAPPDSSTAIRCAGLDWNVDLVNLITAENTPVDDYYGVVRRDNGVVLGVVGKGYTPLQNEEAFNFFDPLIQNKFIDYETAGSLGKGEIVWVLAKIKKDPIFEVVKNDIIEKYLLLSNSHDGSSTVNIKFTPIRVVCQNTLNAALKDGDITRIRHTSGLNRRLEDVKNTTDEIIRIYRGIEEAFRRMFKRIVSKQEVEKYFNDIFPVPDMRTIKTDSQMIKMKINLCIQEQLWEYYESGIGVRELRIAGTLWAAYNAVTQHIDHPKNYKLGDDKLLSRIWFGDGEAIKRKAMTAACKLLAA